MCWVTSADGEYRDGIADVSQAVGPGCWQVGPLDDDTLINGQAEAILVCGVRDDIIVDLKAGNDYFQASSPEGGPVPDDLWSKRQDGDDEVHLEYLYVDGDLKVETGEGDDYIYFWDNVISGSVTFDTSTGDDRVVWLGTPREKIGKNVTIKAGSGNDDVSGRFEAKGYLSVDMSSGDDHFAWDKIDVTTSLILDGGPGRDVRTDGADLQRRTNGTKARGIRLTTWLGVR